MRRPTFPRPRRGFTIVELLVAAALTMFVMYILAACFAAALESFRQIKAVGDMQEKLRSAASTLRQDLTQDHFDRSFNGKAAGPRLSDQRLGDLQWEPPAEGFFRIVQGGRPYIPASIPPQNPPYPNNVVPPFMIDGYQEGLDEEQVRSTRAAPDHVLHFTVKRYVRKREDLFATPLVDPTNAVAALTLPLDYQTPNQFLSQWAEVAYFLVPNGTQANGGLPLFFLVRRERPLVSTAFTGSSVAVAPVEGATQDNGDMSRTMGDQSRPYAATPSYQLFNSSADITVPCRRMNVVNGYPGSPPYNAAQIQAVLAGSDVDSTGNIVPGGTYQPLSAVKPALAGNDLVLTDVLSFEVKVAYEPLVPAVNSATFLSDVQNHPEYPFAYLPQCTTNPGVLGLRIFDTWTKAGPFTRPGTSPPTTLYDYSARTTVVNGQLVPQGWNTTGNAESIPLRVRVRALQIRLRVWDAKTQQVRQVTLIQDM